MPSVNLTDRDYTIIVAKSARVALEELPIIENRWLAAQDAIVALARQCEAFDSDGITLYINPASTGNPQFFRRYDRVGLLQLDEIFQANIPLDSLNLSFVLKMALDDYFDRKAAGHTKANGDIILVITDGEPCDRQDIVKTIVKATTQMEADEELGIGFIQIGDDALAKGFLTALDDDLGNAGAVFDIVHTQTLAEIKATSLITFLTETITD